MEKGRMLWRVRQSSDNANPLLSDSTSFRTILQIRKLCVTHHESNQFPLGKKNATENILVYTQKGFLSMFYQHNHRHIIIIKTWKRITQFRVSPSSSATRGADGKQINCSARLLIVLPFLNIARCWSVRRNIREALTHPAESSLQEVWGDLSFRESSVDSYPHNKLSQQCLFPGLLPETLFDFFYTW